MALAKRTTAASRKARVEIAEDEEHDEDFPIAQYGARLRQIRLMRKLSLAELAAKANISLGMLSHIERGQVTPSLNTVHRLRKALDLPISDLLLGIDSSTGQETSLVIRKPHRLRVALGKTGLVKELLSPIRTSRLEMLMLVLAPGYDSGPTPWSRDGEKAGLVLEGRFSLKIGDQTLVLEPGDSFQFDGNTPHRLANLLETETRVLWIINAEVGA